MAPASALTTHLRSRWERFDGPERLAGIDLARGLAVVGMLAAHLLAIETFSASDSATWVDVVNGRSSILFATLAGVSIALVTGGRTPLRGGARARASGRIAVRAGLLWVLGVLLVSTQVPVYVILPAYAILFLLTLPFLGLPPRTLFVLAGALALIMPWVQAVTDAHPFWLTPDGQEMSTLLGWHYPFPVWIAFVLAGLGVGRLNLRSTRVAAVLAGAGAALAVVGYALHAVWGSDGREEGMSIPAAVWTARAHSSGLLEVVGSGGFALAVIGVSLLFSKTVLRWVVVPLRAVGAMPLTAYTAQLVAWAIVATAVLGSASDLTGFRALDPFWPMTLGLIVACTGWALLVGRGPLEWAVDRVTRWVVPDTERRGAADKLER